MNIKYASALALNGYRRLIRASNKAFGNDKVALKMAKLKLREEFLSKRQVTDTKELKELYIGIDEAEEMLLFHLVQGTKNSRGNYEVKLSEEHKTAIQAEQDLPHGPELSPIDTSVLGSAVKIDKVTSKKKNL